MPGVGERGGLPEVRRDWGDGEMVRNECAPYGFLAQARQEDVSLSDR